MWKQVAIPLLLLYSQLTCAQHDIKLQLDLINVTIDHRDQVKPIFGPLSHLQATETHVHLPFSLVLDQTLEKGASNMVT